jgi:hypothetical protein
MTAGRRGIDGTKEAFDMPKLRTSYADSRGPLVELDRRDPLPRPDKGWRLPVMGPDGGWKLPVVEPEKGWYRGGIA